MLFVFFMALLLAALFGPTLWVNMTLRRYSKDRPDFPGTGGAFARHLLDRMDMADVAVEATEHGDHYMSDKGMMGGPKAVVRLTKDKPEGRSLAAVVVAAHEVGHAIQDRDGHGPTRFYRNTAPILIWIQRIGAAFLIIGPILALFAGAPRLGLLPLLIGFMCMMSPVALRLFSLPLEFDASFNKALPILDQGGYIPKRDLPAARSLLWAAALSHVAGALMASLNMLRWLRLILLR